VWPGADEQAVVDSSNGALPMKAAYARFLRERIA
jgi:hypothetical protein